jgi:hypothetical protein
MEESLGYRNLANIIEAQKRAREHRAKAFPHLFFTSTHPGFLDDGTIPTRQSDFDRPRTHFMIVIPEETGPADEETDSVDEEAGPADVGASPVNEEAGLVDLVAQHVAEKGTARVEFPGSPISVGLVALGG